MRAAVASLALITAATPVAVLAQDTPVIRSLTGVDVVGNRRIDAVTVQTYVDVLPGASVSPNQINEAVRRLYATELFRDVSITPQGSRLIVEVLENPSINRVAFNGNDRFDDADLLAAIEAAPRRAYSRALAERDTRTLIDLYRSTGRFSAQITPRAVDLPENRVDLFFDVVEGEDTGIADISFVGNEAFSDRRLRREIETRETSLLNILTTTDVYDPDRLEFDKELLRRHYLNNGYADFRVLSATAELSPDREDFFITFTLDEGPVYTIGEIDIISPFAGLDPENLIDLIEVETGDIYSARQVDKSIDNLVFRAGQDGFAFVEVRPGARKNADQTIDIVFELFDAPRVFVERIDITGNSRTIDRVLRRQFRIAEGDAFNSREVANATERLRALGFFNTVNVRTERGSADDRAIIKVEVEERLTGAISFGVGYSSSDGPTADVSISERNFLGRGQFVRVRAAFSETTQAFDFDFREPALLDRDLAAGFRLYYLNEDLSQFSSFEETNIGFAPFVEFPLSDNGRLKLAYSISQDEIRDISAGASPAIRFEEGTEITSALAATYTYDQRNSLARTTEGYLLTGTQEFAGLGGDAIHAKTTARASAWTSFFEEEVIAKLEVEGGAILGLGGHDPRVTDRFLPGGDSFRGFERGGLGPRDLTTRDALGGKFFGVVRADVSFPLGLPEELGIYGGLFADFGTVWGLDHTQFNRATNRPGCADPSDAASCRVIDDGLEFRGSVGVSLFIDSGFGPLRLNFAYPFLKEDGDRAEYFRFTAGTRF